MDRLLERGHVRFVSRSPLSKTIWPHDGVTGLFPKVFEVIGGFILSWERYIVGSARTFTCCIAHSGEFMIVYVPELWCFMRWAGLDEFNTAGA